MELLFLEPIYTQAIWGGKNIKEIFNRVSSFDKISESWEISAHKHGSNIIKNSKITLLDLFNDVSNKRHIFGCYSLGLEHFPILNKIIDANDKLSIQVHPSNSYAEIFEKDTGKTEMWYVLSANPDAKIICGTIKGTNKDIFKNAILSGTIENNLLYHNIQKGDMIFIPAGTVHALLGGAIVYEVQQNSDLTYRIFDWDRVDKNNSPRETHIDKAINVINFDFSPKVINTNKQIEEYKICSNTYFNVNIINVKKTYFSCSDKNTFFAMTVLEGNGFLKTNTQKYNLNKGQSFIIPAFLGKFYIEAENNMKIIKTFI